MLIRHTERILTAAHGVLSKRGRPRVLRAIKEVGVSAGMCVFVSALKTVILKHVSKEGLLLDLHNTNT